MTYLAGFIAVGVIGLFLSDWLEADRVSYYWPQHGEGEIGKSGNYTLPRKGELAGFLVSPKVSKRVYGWWLPPSTPSFTLLLLTALANSDRRFFRNFQ
jgi:hypothetical protein